MDKKIIIKWNKDNFNIYIKKEKLIKDLKHTITNMTGIKIADQRLEKSDKSKKVISDFDLIKNFQDGCVLNLITTGSITSDMLADEKKTIIKVKEAKDIKNEETNNESSDNTTRIDDIGFNYSRTEVAGGIKTIEEFNKTNENENKSWKILRFFIILFVFIILATLIITYILRG